MTEGSVLLISKSLSLHMIYVYLIIVAGLRLYMIVVLPQGLSMYKYFRRLRPLKYVLNGTIATYSFSRATAICTVAITLFMDLLY